MSITITHVLLFPSLLIVQLLIYCFYHYSGGFIDRVAVTRVTTGGSVEPNGVQCYKLMICLFERCMGFFVLPWCCPRSPTRMRLQECLVALILRNLLDYFKQA
jgi:hypothetical protein